MRGRSGGVATNALIALGGLLAVLVSCARTEHTVVDWHLDLVLEAPESVATARVCSNRAPNREFIVVDSHFVLTGVPMEGDVELTIDLYDASGVPFASSGRLRLDAPFLAVQAQACGMDSCESECVVEPSFDGTLGGSLGVRLVTEN